MSSRQRPPFPSRPLWSRLTLPALLFLILGTLYLFHLGYRQERERVLESVRGEFHERLNALERATSLTSTQLAVLRRRAENLMEEGGPGEGSAAFLAGATYERSGDFFLFPPGGPSPPSAERGVVFGVGRPREKDGIFMRDLSLAAALLPLLKASCDTSETMKSCYFFSNSLVSSTYPAVDPGMLAEDVSPDGTLKGAFDLFYRPHEGRYLNPSRSGYWTDVYLDRTGLGLMVTHATPLYDGERFVGIIAVDVTLGYLERFVSGFGGPFGRMLVTSDGGKVLADSAVAPGAVTGGIALLGDRLPPSLREEAREIIRGEDADFVRLVDYYVCSRVIEAAPWTMVYLMDKSDLSAFLALNRIVLTVGSVTLVYLFLIFSFAHRQVAAERARHEAEKKYRAIFDHQFQLIGLLNPEGTLLSTNEASLLMIGEKKEEVLGRPFWETPWWRHSPEQQERLKEEIARAAAGTFVRFEATHLDKEGGVRFLDFSLRPVEDDDGRVSFIIPEGRDITETKLTELRYQALFEGAADAIITMKDVMFTDCNQKALELFGCTREQLLGENPVRFSPEFQPDGRRSDEKAAAKIEAVMGGTPQSFEWAHVKYDGTPLEVEVTLNTVELSTGPHVQAVVRDITARKSLEREQSRAAEVIRKSEERFRALFRTTPIPMTLTTVPEGRLVDMNEEFCEVSGYSREEAVGKTTLELNIFADPKERKEMGRILAEQGECNNFEHQFRAKNGSLRTALLSGKIIDLGGVPHLLSAGKDITELRQVGDALRKSEARQSLILRSLPIVFYVADVSGTYGGTWVSEQISTLTGFAAKRFTDDPDFWVSGLHPEDRQRVLDEFHVLVGGKETISQEYRWKGSDGRYRWFLDEAVLVRDDDGKAKEIVGIWFDLSARKETEQRLARLAAVIEQADEDVIITDREGEILYVNPAFEKVSGYSSEEVLGKNPRFLKSGEQDSSFYHRLWETISGGSVWRGSIVNRKKSGDLFIQDATISPFFERNGAIIGYASIRRDITDQLRLEEQLVQSQKMEAIGTLAGGIAHDFNNILAAIMGFAELAKMDAAGDDKVEESLDQVLHAGNRARDLVGQILAFSRQTKKAPVPVQPKTVVMEVLKLLRASLPATISITQNLNSDSSIIADPTQLHQVMMNLCTNAAHAMREEGGTLSVSLVEVDLGAEFVAGRTGMVPGRHLLLAVGDTGHGMTAETVERIFDPFFTTKPKEEGTGMGLSVVHGIVRECGGAVTVESRPGEGTEFSLFLPLAGERVVEAVAAPMEVVGGTERILFVDDEAIQGELAEEGLGRFGYRVTAVTDPEEALALFQKDPRAFDLVVTDMTMPKMTGDILAKRIMLFREDMPVIICTGFSERIDERKTKAMGIKALVFKPVVSSEMARVIRTVLDG